MRAAADRTFRMRIDVKTDAGIPGREAVARVVEAEVERALEPFSDSLIGPPERDLPA